MKRADWTTPLGSCCRYQITSPIYIQPGLVVGGGCVVFMESPIGSLRRWPAKSTTSDVSLGDDFVLRRVNKDDDYHLLDKENSAPLATLDPTTRASNSSVVLTFRDSGQSVFIFWAKSNDRQRFTTNRNGDQVRRQHSRLQVHCPAVRGHPHNHRLAFAGQDSATSVRLPIIGHQDDGRPTTKKFPGGRTLFSRRICYSETGHKR